MTLKFNRYEKKLEEHSLPRVGKLFGESLVLIPSFIHYNPATKGPAIMLDLLAQKKNSKKHLESFYFHFFVWPDKIDFAISLCGEAIYSIPR